MMPSLDNGRNWVPISELKCRHRGPNVGSKGIGETMIWGTCCFFKFVGNISEEKYITNNSGSGWERHRHMRIIKTK